MPTAQFYNNARNVFLGEWLKLCDGMEWNRLAGTGVATTKISHKKLFNPHKCPSTISSFT